MTHTIMMVIIRHIIIDLTIIIIIRPTTVTATTMTVIMVATDTVIAINVMIIMVAEQTMVALTVKVLAEMLPLMLTKTEVLPWADVIARKVMK